LFAGKTEIAAEHYLKAAQYFAPFDQEEGAKLLSRAAGDIYEIERRARKPNLAVAIRLLQHAIEITATGGTSLALRLYRLALVQQTEAGKVHTNSLNLFNEAIENAKRALSYKGKDFEDAERRRWRVH